MARDRLGYGIFTLLVSTAFSGMAAAAALQQAETEDAVWLGTGTSIEQFREGHDSRRIRSSHRVQTLAVDDRSLQLWAYGDKTLSVYEFDGKPSKQFQVTVPSLMREATADQLGCPTSLNLSSPIIDADLTAMAVDPIQGEVWVSDNKWLVRLSSSGRPLMARQLPAAISTLSFDTTTSTAWAAVCGAVVQFDRAGEVVSRLAPTSSGGYIEAVDVDSHQGVVWTADGKKVSLMTPEGGRLLEVPVAARLVKHGSNGTAWVAGASSLTRMAVDGHSTTVIAKSDRKFGQIRALVAHPVDGSAWAATDTELLHISATGAVTSYPTAASEQLGRALAIYSDSIPPDVSLITSNKQVAGEGAAVQVEVYYNDIGRGADPETLRVRLNGKNVAGSCRVADEHSICSLSGPWRSGANEVSSVVSDFAGNASMPASVTINYPTEAVDTSAIPQLPAHSLSVSPSRNGTARVHARRGTFRPLSALLIENLRSHEQVSGFADRLGGFAAPIKARNGDDIRATVKDQKGKALGSLKKRVGAPPKPASRNAKALSKSGVTKVATANSFLTEGASAVQFAVAEGAVDPVRGAVIRGTVLGRDGLVVPGVTVEVRDHPEFGYAVSDTLGEYSLMVNGGGALVIDLSKDEYIPVQRQVDVPWSDYALVPNVTLIKPDTAGTAITFGPTSVAQVAQSSVSTDSDGTRTATLLFQPGTTASLVFADGSTQPVSSDTIRVTEFTVGQSGISAMPGSLPSSSAYTYAAEMTGDQQVALGAKTMQFSTPAVLYLTNFLTFPVGTTVPMANYDSTQANWIPTDNGEIVKILSVTAGKADIDIDGSGSAASSAALVAKGITDAERTQLATIYAVGTQLWRVPVPHFCPYDPNYPHGLPPSAAPPKQPKPSDGGNDGTNNPNCQNGSIIECQNQVLGESVGVKGTPFHLNYRSNRVPGQASVYTATIPLSGSSIPSSLKRIDAVVKVAGRSFKYSYAAATNQSLPFTWDGKDYAGRVVQGQQLASVDVGYVYDGVYQGPGAGVRAFAQYGNALSIGNARSEFVINQGYKITLGVLDSRLLGLGGWSLSPQHFYDPIGQSLYLGDGTTIRSSKVADVFKVIKSGGSGQLLYEPLDLAVVADGTIYVADNAGIVRVAPDGATTLYTGGGNSTSDGILASESSSKAKTLAVDRNGVVYFTTGNKVRKVSKDGRVYTVAGQATAGYAGDNGPATQALLENLGGLAVGPEGNLYIASGKTVRMVTPDGYIYTVAGTGVAGSSGDGGQARLARFYNASWVAVDRSGNLYITDGSKGLVRKVGSDGIIRTVAGNGTTVTDPLNGEGGPATSASLVGAGKVATLNDGSFYIGFVNPLSSTIRYVTGKGIIKTAAGWASYGTGATCGGNGGPARKATIGYKTALATDSANKLIASEWRCHNLFTLAGDLPWFASPQGLGESQYEVASSDGSELFTFDAQGRHLSTRSTLTGELLYSFGYSTAGWLTSITDGSGNLTQIERDGAGTPTAIVAPHGQRTTLAVNTDGYLTGITAPGGLGHTFTYFAGGLLKTFTTPRNLTTAFTYDANSRLASDLGPDGYQSTLTRATLTDGYKVTVTSAAGRQKQYQVRYPDGGGEVLTNTDSAGLQSTTTYAPDASRVDVAADGTKRTTVTTGDTRFGMQAPLTSSVTLLFPSGLTSTTSSTRQVTLSDPNNPLSLTQLVETATLNGNTWQSSYNAATKTFTRTSPLGRVSTLTVDSLGRPVSAQVAGVAAQTYAYDGQGRLQDVSQASGGDSRLVHYAYNAQGLVQSIQDPLSRSVAFAYDASDRLTTQTLPGSRTLAYTLDANDNLTGLTPPGKPQHSFSHTAGNQVDLYTPPLATGVGTRVSDYGYNLDRQLTSLTRPDGQTLTWTYGATTGRLEQLSIPAGSPNAGSYSYSYGPTTGLLTGITAPGGVALAYTYDGALLKSETLTGVVTGTLSYSYDNSLRRSGLTIAGTAFSYGYDSDGLLTLAGALSLGRDAATGFLTSTSLGSVSSSHGYNGFGESASDSYQYGGSSLYSATYSRDLLGRITDKVETVGSGSSKTYHYGYSTEGRLESVNLNGSLIESYGYDANGNRTSSNGVTASFDDQDRLLSAGGISYSYGANGELQTRTVSGQTQTYSYDALGNLISAQLPGKTIGYVVDGRNRRIGRKLNGTLVQGFLYDGQLEPVAELDGSGAVLSRFIYGSKGHVPDYLVKAGVTYRIISDQLGSPRLVVNTTDGSIAQQLDYDAWGKVTLDSNPGFQPFGFAGGLYDQDTQLTRFGARDYDAQVGRWTAKDPIRFEGGDSNVYAYVGGNPVYYYDSTGLTPLLAGEAGLELGALANALFYTITGTTIGAGIYDLTHVESRMPPGYWDGPSGAVEWGKRNGVDPREAKNRFHRGVKGKTTAVGGSSACGVNPDTGDVIDPSGESIGNLGDVDGR